MLVDDTNQIVNHQRYHTRDIYATVRELTSEQKQRLAEQIQLQKGICNLTGREYNHQDCERIEKALRAKEEKK